MELAVAERLIKKGIEFSKESFHQNSQFQIWADLGAGKGLFTTALSKSLAPGSTIYAIDTDKKVLNKIEVNKNISLQLINADFVHDSLPFESLDGILMANSLHFVEDKHSFLKHLKLKLKPEGKLILVEYDMDKPNPWVPYPISFISLQALVAEAGFHTVSKIGEEPSVYNRANIYAALILQ